MAQKQNRVPLSDIVLLPEFQSANAAQQLFVRLYLGVGETTGKYDAVAATRAAYPKCSEDNLSTRSSHVLSHKRIREILAIAFGKPTLTSVLPGLDQAIQRSIKSDMKGGGGLSVATTRAITFYEGQVQAQRAREDGGVQRFEIGDIFEQSGKSFRVVAVDLEETA